MLVRVAAGNVEMVGNPNPMVLLVLTFLLTTKIASKIYRTGILMYGKSQLIVQMAALQVTTVWLDNCLMLPEQQRHSLHLSTKN